MAYSNIKRDKVQVRTWQKLKTIVVGLVLVIVTFSAGINIWQQVTTLSEAKKRNQQTQNKIFGLETENKSLEKQIGEATTSAYKERKVREYLGLGESNDHWLLTDLESAKTVGLQEIPESGTKAVILQWWSLFIK